MLPGRKSHNLDPRSLDFLDDNTLNTVKSNRGDRKAL